MEWGYVFIILTLCNFTCEASLANGGRPTRAARTPISAKPVQSKQTADSGTCATTEICYDPATNRMHAEWSGINMGCNQGEGCQTGPPGPPGRPGQAGPPGVSSSVDMEQVRKEMTNMFSKMAPIAVTGSGSCRDCIQGLSARVLKLEDTLRRLVQPSEKPKVKPGVGLGIPPGEVDILGWVGASNGYEYFISGRVTYDEARKFCDDRNATLAIAGMRDPEIIKYLLKNFIEKRKVDVWIGLNDLEIEGDWYWDDGVRSTYFNTAWADLQPDDGYQNEDCAFLSYKKGIIYDYRCSGDKRALCER